MVLLVKDTILNLVLLFAFTKREWTTYGHAITLQLNWPKKHTECNTSNRRYAPPFDWNEDFRNDRLWKYRFMSQTVLLGTLVEFKSNHVDTDIEGCKKKGSILTGCLNKKSPLLLICFAPCGEQQCITAQETTRVRKTQGQGRGRNRCLSFFERILF